jgi:4-hydroxybenzoate polyprenyltransferase
MPGIVKLLAAVVSLARPYNALLPLLATAAGFGAAAGTNFTMLTVAMAACALIHSAITMWNDIEDQAVDELNGIHTISRLRQRGLYRQLKVAVVVLLALATALSWQLPMATIAFLACLIVLGWVYNARPFRASVRPLASMVVLAISYGLLPVAVGASLGPNPVSAIVLLLAVSWTAVRVSVSLLKDYKDAPGDAKAGKKTFLLVYGARRVATFSIGLGALGYLGVVATCAMARLGAGLLALLAVAAWLVFERTALLRSHSYAELGGVFRLCLRYQLVFDGLAAAWLITP